MSLPKEKRVRPPEAVPGWTIRIEERKGLRPNPGTHEESIGR